MAWSANGYEFPDKELSRVKYDLLTDEQIIVSFSSEDTPPEGYLISGDEIILD